MAKRPIQIRVRRAFPPYHEDVLPPGWLFDERGQVRRGKCGHPVHPVKGCRVCPLLAQGDLVHAGLRRHFSLGRGDDDVRARALAKWGSRKGRRRANAPDRPPAPPPSNGRHEDGDENMNAALMGIVIAAVGDVRDDIARICPPSSRTIRFRHFPRGGTEADDPLVIGAPLPLLAPLDLDALDVLLSTWGSSVVAQQATLTQTLVDLDLPEEPTTEMAALQALADASDLVD